MKVIERIELIRSIAVELQQRMSTLQINAYLSRHGIAITGTEIPASKRIYVEQLLENIPDASLIVIGKELNQPVPEQTTGSSPYLTNLMDKHVLRDCQADFERAVDNLTSDPDQALASACSTLESICKAILDKMYLDYPKDQSIQPLVNTVARAMNLSPDGHADPEIKAILGGLASACQGIGSIRTKSSSAHGKGAKNYRLEERHARLAIGAATTISIFLIETFQNRFANKVAISEVTRQEVLKLVTTGRNFYGKLEMMDFLGRVFPLDEMPSTDVRVKTARGDIIQHMIANYDWQEGFLLYEYLNLLHCDDELFMKFVCQVLHPVAIEDNDSAKLLANAINLHLMADGYELQSKSKISGRDVFSFRRLKI